MSNCQLSIVNWARIGREPLLPKDLRISGPIPKRSVSFRFVPELSETFRFVPEFSVSFRPDPWGSAPWTGMDRDSGRFRSVRPGGRWGSAADWLSARVFPCPAR